MKGKQEQLAASGGFETIVGQQGAIERLKAFGAHYLTGSRTPSHILITGEAGSGKKTLARTFAQEFSLELKEVAAADFLRALDLSTALSLLERHQVLLISNVHELKRAPGEILKEALIDFKIDMVIGKGPGARSSVYRLEPFICIATTSFPAKCSVSVLDAFLVKLNLHSYSEEELKGICEFIARKNNLVLSQEIISAISSFACGSTKKVETFVHQLQSIGKESVNEEDAVRFFATLGLKFPVSASVDPTTNLEQLSGINFEQLITMLLGKMGFQADITKASGDGGIDIVAHLDKPIMGGRYLIQCKRFSPGNSVGAPVVREFYGVLTADRKAVKGIFITTSNFTDQAREFARDLPVELIDGKQLRTLLAEYGLQQIA